MIDIELPKRKEIVVNEISDTYIIRDNKRMNIVIVIILLLVVLFLGLYFYYNSEVKLSKMVEIKDIEVLSYDISKGEINIAVTPSINQEYCALANDNELIFDKLDNGKCLLTVSFNKQSVYFKSSLGLLSRKLEINNYVVDIILDDVYYLPVGSEINLEDGVIKVGEPNITWIGGESELNLVNSRFLANNVDDFNLVGMFNNREFVKTRIVVTDTIVAMPDKFDTKKEFLTCEVFTYEEATLLDEILEYRIEEAGYGTRAGAVAAARFLTLEFPYRISYYWENGRLNNTGRHYVDGEGRYYHKGLYLDESKYEDIVASLQGPAMWGCKMVSYEDDPPNFVPGGKYPNGLDCSGFVTWALLNGGFDVGDRGAGESPTPGQLTDLGEFRLLTTSLIKSGEIKVGDLFNFWGHISILIGEDDDNYYIAESLNTYKGVVVKTYSKKKVMKTFKYVVLMDDVYKEDGNLTKMWN